MAVTIRPTKVSDAQRLFDIVTANRDVFRRWFGWVDNLTLEKEVAYVESVIQTASNRHFVIEVNQQVVGTIDLHKIDEQHHNGEIGYWLDADFRGQGVMTEALQQLLVFAKDTLKLHRVVILAATENSPSQQVAIRAQFEREGILREAVRVNDSYQDMVVYSHLFT